MEWIARMDRLQDTPEDLRTAHQALFIYLFSYVPPLHLNCSSLLPELQRRPLQRLTCRQY